MSDLPHCPSRLPNALLEPLRQLAEAWARSPSRPYPTSDVEEGWTGLLQTWSEDDTLPLFVRKTASNRGQIIVHMTGRKLVPVDNSPAQWAFSMALRGKWPMVAELRTLLQSDHIPVAMILKTVEREQASYRCTLGKAESLNLAGWKLSHIDSIGLRQPGELSSIEINKIKTHFVHLMNPSNMYLVPKVWAGLGEMPEMIKAVQEFRRAKRAV